MTTQHWYAIAILLVVLLGIYALMRFGWNRRGKHVDLPPLQPAPAEFAAEHSVEGVYVSTTLTGDWLERVVTHTLGQRSNVLIETTGQSVRLRREGVQDIYLHGGDLLKVSRADGMAGKFVGKQRLVVLSWAHHGTALDTGLHVSQRAESDELAARLSAIIHSNPPADDRVAMLRDAVNAAPDRPANRQKNEEA
ncbi:hypothetical protein JT358_04300 [Micrococcales bacterium 31B]|nr:hypothetical protein [Micrococcales bacterium 31B]